MKVLLVVNSIGSWSWPPQLFTQFVAVGCVYITHAALTQLPLQHPFQAPCNAFPPSHHTPSAVQVKLLCIELGAPPVSPPDLTIHNPNPATSGLYLITV